jgi:hypothetical protein
MKKTLLLITSVFIAGLSFGQYGIVTNGGFENWTVNVLYENPNLWKTSNYNNNLSLVNATKDTDAQNGTYSIKLISNITGTDTADAYTILGDFGDNGPSNGFLYTTVVDTLKGWYKYSTQGTDSATLLAVMFNQDTVTEMMAILVAGTQSTWTEFAMPFNAGLVAPDSMLVAFASSNALNDYVENGSWIMVDNISFASSTVSSPPAIPNGDFESWTDISSEDADNWFSYNQLLAGNGGTPTIKTLDSQAGTYALETKTMQWGPSDTLRGVVTNGYFDNNGIQGGVSYTEMPTQFEGYYKYAPSGTDTAFVSITFFNAGVPVESQGIQIGGNVTTYTNFTLPVNLTNPPDTMQIVIWPGDNPGSVLKIDELQLTGGNVGIENLKYIPILQNQLLMLSLG